MSGQHHCGRESPPNSLAVQAGNPPEDGRGIIARNVREVWREALGPGVLCWMHHGGTTVLFPCCSIGVPYVLHTYSIQVPYNCICFGLLPCPALVRHSCAFFDAGRQSPCSAADRKSVV